MLDTRTSIYETHHRRRTRTTSLESSNGSVRPFRKNEPTRFRRGHQRAPGDSSYRSIEDVRMEAVIHRYLLPEQPSLLHILWICKGNCDYGGTLLGQQTSGAQSRDFLL